MVRPWAEAGYECWCIDINHDKTLEEFESGGLINYIQADVYDFCPGNFKWEMVFAFPPCTDLANSGNRWKADKGIDALYEAVRLVKRCADICRSAGPAWMLENPVGSMNAYWKPKYTFNPCDYAGYLDEDEQKEEQFSKKTCLWAGQGFVMPIPKPLPPILGSKMHLLPPSADRADLRSVTPKGFALAVYLANARNVSPEEKNSFKKVS